MRNNRDTEKTEKSEKKGKSFSKRYGDTDELKRLKDDLEHTRKQLRRLENQYHRVLDERDELCRQKDALQEQFDCISKSQTWKMTKPFRKLMDWTKKMVFHVPPLHSVVKFFRIFFHNGPRAAFFKLKMKMAEKRKMRKRRKIDLSKISDAQRAEESAATFEKDVCFSILVPLYNTPLNFLQEMIASVQGQTYQNWELCLADGSDDEHREVGREVALFVKKDPRIKYLKLKKNLGISENTNACIEMATGNYIALFDHDDLLHPSALYEMMKAICEKDADFVYTDEATFESPNIKKIITVHYKPDYAPDNLRANNYICHFSAFSREVLEKTGKFRPEFDGSQDHDMILRLTENAKHVVHIPKLLYFWRSHPLSVAMDINSKTYAIEAGKRAVLDSIHRAGYDAEVTSSRAFPTIYRIRYRLKAEEQEKVSIIIPNKNHVKTLKKCIRSIFERTTYKNYEILIVDNGSDQQELFDYYEFLSSNPKVRILHYDEPFNYSAINNFAARQAEGSYYVLMNNDIQVLSRRWIEELLSYVQREDVGAAGAMLYYPDNTIQHAGIILKLGADRVAGHAFHNCPKGAIGYMGRLCYSQDMSAVTAACMMVKASVFREVGGLDESFPVAFNDVDFCMKIRQAGKLIVWTPYAEFYHYESRTRGKDSETKERKLRFQEDCERFRKRWKDRLEEGDPYYNPNFSLDSSTFEY